MRDISEAGNLSSIYTNQCLQVTIPTVIARAGEEARDICAVTGHRNEASLNWYIQGPSMQQRCAFSETLASHGKRCMSSSTPTRQRSSVPTCTVTDWVPTCTVTSSPAPGSPYSSQTQFIVQPVLSTQLRPISPNVRQITVDWPLSPSQSHSLSANLTRSASSLFSGAVFNGPTSIHLHFHGKNNQNEH